MTKDAGEAVWIASVGFIWVSLFSQYTTVNSENTLTTLLNKQFESIEIPAGSVQFIIFQKLTLRICVNTVIVLQYIL